MSKKEQNKNRRNCGIDLGKKGCHNCANCAYVDDGNYICNEGTPTVVITGFSAPTERFFACAGRRWKKQ